MGHITDMVRYVKYFPPHSKNGEGDRRAAGVEGYLHRRVIYPSTMLRMAPLPIKDGEESCCPQTQMGPALLPAPLSPAPFPAECWLPYPCLIAMPGRSDAHRASASALGTGGASHRDALRIGPDPFGREPARDHCICQSVRFAAALRPRQSSNLFPALLRRRLVPSGGRFDSEKPLLPPGGSKGVSLLHQRITYPCGLPFLWLPSGVFAPLFPDLAIKIRLCFHTFRPTWSLPMTLRLSRHLRFARLTPKGYHARFPTLLRASLPSRSG